MASTTPGGGHLWIDGVTGTTRARSKQEAASTDTSECESSQVGHPKVTYENSCQATIRS
jgi:hypothetical protein